VGGIVSFEVRAGEDVAADEQGIGSGLLGVGMARKGKRKAERGCGADQNFWGHELSVLKAR
jgi:hypothetical protein